MNPEPEQLLAEQWKTVERLIQIACRYGHLGVADADDFESMVKLKLFEKDFQIIRRFRAECRFETYLNLIVHRTFVDFCVMRFGKWHASAAADRLGPIALELERMVYRDGSSPDEAISRLLTSYPETGRRDIEKMLLQLPTRQRKPTAVSIDTVADLLCADSDADVLVVSNERRKVSDRAGAVIRDYLGGLPDNDRLMLQFSFESDMEIASIARALDIEQKPLYRRRKRLLHELREKMVSANVTETEISDLIGHMTDDSDFGLRKKDEISPSRTDEGLSSS